MGQPLPAADGHDLRTSFQKTALIEYINNITLTLGQKKSDQRNDHLAHPQHNEQNAAKDDEKSQITDEWIGVGRENSADPDGQNAKQGGKHPPFDFNARIEPFEKVL